MADFYGADYGAIWRAPEPATVGLRHNGPSRAEFMAHRPFPKPFYGAGYGASGPKPIGPIVWRILARASAGQAAPP